MPRVFVALFAGILLLAASPCFTYGQQEGSVLQGIVRDSLGAPVSGASVRVERGGVSIATTATDAKGAYRFSDLEAGRVSVSAVKTGFQNKSSGTVELSSGETKTVDLTLVLEKSGKSGPEDPQFYDEPQFTVAGVADIANHGGHGSDTVSRTAQALAKDIASDSKPPSRGPSNGAPPDENSWRTAVARDPESFEANQHLGLILERESRPAEALPYLERARKIQPDDYLTNVALARAYADSGQLAKGHQTARTLLAKHDGAELHALLGDIEEKQGESVQAEHDYQRAAELDSSEPNLFAWGAQLLLHRALEPALQVFSKGARLYPESVRMLVGLGVSQYASGSPALAAQTLCRASDLEPANTGPYLVLGRAQLLDPPGSSIVTEKMERFVRLHPENALAHYYYAVTLQKRKESNSVSLSHVEELLKASIELDPKFASAHFQLGTVYQAQNQWPPAITEYQQAIALDPQLPEAHYRLAQAYRQTGDKTKAEQELVLSEEASKKNLETAEKDSQQIPQFVYTLRHPESPSH